MEETIEQAIYTVINLVQADEAEAYYEYLGEGEMPDCKSMPNNPRVSNDGLFGLCTGTNFMYALQTLTQAEAEALMLTENWKSKEEEI